jgi:hypothetical protein
MNALAIGIDEVTSTARPMPVVLPLGLLEVRLHIDSTHERELNDWYDREHVAELLSVPGVLAAVRYVEEGSAVKMHRAFYELAHERVVSGPAFDRLLANRTPWSKRMYALYDNVHRIRNTYRLLDSHNPSGTFRAPWLYCFKCDVPPEMERDFNRSYDDELLEALGRVSGCLGARRFLAVDGQQKYMALYGLESLDVMNSEAWMAASNSPRRSAIRKQLLNVEKGCFRMIRPIATRQ